MLTVFNNTNIIPDKLHSIIEKDPVTPGIPIFDRLGKNGYIAILNNIDHPYGVCCFTKTGSIPNDHTQLFDDGCNDTNNIACLYTIWSLVKGSGRVLIRELVNYVEFEINCKTIVTLSPKSDMAMNFHISNGATVFRTNNNTVNYRYR